MHFSACSLTSKSWFSAAVLNKFFDARTGHYHGRHISGHNSPAARAREPFKPSKDPESLLDTILKNWKVLDLVFFVDNFIIWVGFRIFGRGYLALRATLTRHFLAQIFLETRL